MKYSIPLVAILCLGLLVGCKSTPEPMQKAIYITAVSTSVAFGVERYPKAVPYLRVAQPIICAAGHGTNITPAEIVSALTNSPAANAVATDEGKAIMNGVLAIYVGVFQSYGTNYIAHNEQLGRYLQWTCDAVALSLPSVATIGTLSRTPPKPLPPHIH